MAIRKRGKNRWQVRVRPFPDMTCRPKRPPRRSSSTEAPGEARHLYREKPATLGTELDGYLARKTAMGGRRGPLRPASVKFLQQSAALGAAPRRADHQPPARDGRGPRRRAGRGRAGAAANELELLKACLRAAARAASRSTPGSSQSLRCATSPSEGRRARACAARRDRLDDAGTDQAARAVLRHRRACASPKRSRSPTTASTSPPARS